MNIMNDWMIFSKTPFEFKNMLYITVIQKNLRYKNVIFDLSLGKNLTLLSIYYTFIMLFLDKQFYQNC